jgi:predicted small lipoprotein YifL
LKKGLIILRKKLTKALAFLMVLTFIFSFAACGDKNEPTTLPKATEVGATTEVQTSTSEDETTTVTETTTGSEIITTTIKQDDVSTTKKPTVTEKVNISAPVNGSKADIVKFYNTYANAAKAYKGTVKIHIEQQKTAKLTKFSVGFLKSLANSMLSKAMGDKEVIDKTFVNGKSGDKTLLTVLPRDNQPQMSELTAAHVKSASCKAVNGGWEIKLKLIEEKVGYNGKPAAHMASMDILSVTDKDVDPFTIKKDNCEFDYKGATITAVVSNNGQLTSLKIYEPVLITATLKKGVSVDAVVDGAWKQDITFKY